MHFRQRAAGQRSIARGSDLFRGRVKAVESVRAWLSADVASGVPLVVTGLPGSGKSAVLARAALRLDRPSGLAFHAHLRDHRQLRRAGRADVRDRHPPTWQELIAELTHLPSRDVLALAVNALDVISTRNA